MDFNYFAHFLIEKELYFQTIREREREREVVKLWVRNQKKIKVMLYIGIGTHRMKKERIFTYIVVLLLYFQKLKVWFQVG